MKPILLIHGYSAESKATEDAAIRGIYGALPAILRERFGATVEELDLSRYVSLEDGITIDDVSRAMNRALEKDFPHLLSGGCNVILHSTGALVVRNWLRRYWDTSQPCPFERVIHLAGANFGSGWAHIGRTQLAKWVRMIFQRVERGVNVLNALELGSKWTIEMQIELDRKIKAAPEENRPLEFCLIGSQRPDEFTPIPVKYATEEATDGVVRVPGGNLNFSYIKIVPLPHVADLSPDEIRRSSDKGFAVTSRAVRNPNLPTDDRSGSEHYHVVDSLSSTPTPFAVVFQCSHTYKRSSIIDGEFPREQILNLIGAALETTSATVNQAIASFNASHAETLAKVRQMPEGRFAIFVNIPRREQYNKYAQVVFRVFDQDGAPVKHFNIFFNSFGGGENPQQLINDCFKDGHPCEQNSNTITFFIKRLDWKQTGETVRDGDWFDVIDQVNGIDLEIDAREHGNELVHYLPLRYRLDREMLNDWLKPDQTLIVDVCLWRMPAENVFKIVGG